MEMFKYVYFASEIMIFGEEKPKRLDELISIERDPYSTQRGKWVSISNGDGVTEHGTYCGMTNYGNLVLNPYLSVEYEPRIPGDIRSFILQDRPAFIANTPSLKMIPVREEQITRLCTPLTQEQIDLINSKKNC